jgi:hypothetical protein
MAAVITGVLLSAVAGMPRASISPWMSARATEDSQSSVFNIWHPLHIFDVINHLLKVPIPQLELTRKAIMAKEFQPGMPGAVARRLL